MQIKLTSVLVDDQDKALRFYTEVLGFLKRNDVPVGDYKWLTVVSPEAPDGVELLLEPMGHEFARAYQKQLHDSGIPAASFFSENVRADYDRMTALGATFTVAPTKEPWGTFAIVEDTCGNLIQIQGP